MAKDSTITLHTPTRSGYTFAGWYNGTTKVAAEYKAENNITLTAKWTSTSSGGYYYYQPTTDTKTTDTKGSPKTFDAGVGIYAVTAGLSVTGMAWTAKKRGNCPVFPAVSYPGAARNKKGTPSGVPFLFTQQGRGRPLSPAPSIPPWWPRTG